jgi:hypothetical protein
LTAIVVLLATPIVMERLASTVPRSSNPRLPDLGRAGACSMRMQSFDESLAALLSKEEYVDGRWLLILALAERGGWQDQVHHELTRRPAAGTVYISWVGKRPVEELRSLWTTIQEKSAPEIGDAIHTLVLSPKQRDSSPIFELALTHLLMPLVVLDRRDAAHQLAEKGERLGGQLLEVGALIFAGLGDWDRALSLLENAHARGASRHTSFAAQGLLWKHAYLQGEIETAMPRLARIPFDSALSHTPSLREWLHKTYRIRAGKDDVVVPVLEHSAQPPGYVEAAATKVAALDRQGRTVEADTLRSVLKPLTTSLEVPQRGIAVSLAHVPAELFRAEVRIAVRNKDHSSAVRLAASNSRYLFAAALDVVIDAYLEEGDWRSAATTAQAHDPRSRPPVPGFDDTRLSDYLDLQFMFAVAASRGGDDAAALAHASNWLAALCALPEDDRLGRDQNGGWQWPMMLLAGVAEGKISRNLLAVLLPAFRNAH